MNSGTSFTLARLVADGAARHPALDVLTFVAVTPGGGYDTEVRRYGELLANGQALARALRQRGVGPGDRFAVMMANLPAFVEAMVAAAVLGAVFVPVDPRTLGAKLAHMLDFTQCRGVVCADAVLPAVLAVEAECASLQWAIVVPTGQEAAGTPRRIALQAWADALATPGADLPLHPSAADDAMFLMFTSGTTGHPKAVVNSHGKYLTLTHSPKAFGLTADDRYYTGLSLTHINAQGTLAGALGQGIPVVLSRKFTKTRLWDICRRHGCTTFNLLGGMIPEVWALPERPDDADNPVRMVVSSGMPPHLWAAFERRFGVRLTEVYGATEGGGMRNVDGQGPVGSIGRPAPGWIAAILDADGRECPPHAEGEICFRREDGQPVVVQYLDNPQASSDKVRDGWLHMGDLGHRDDAGWFFFHHRVGGGVRRNGDFVNTALVETVLTQSRWVADAFVYGVATARNVAGEKTLVAAVVRSEAATCSDDELRERLLAHCRAHLERNDVPEVVQLLAEIPKTVSEKPVEAACVQLLGRDAA